MPGGDLILIHFGGPINGGQGYYWVRSDCLKGFRDKEGRDVAYFANPNSEGTSSDIPMMDALTGEETDLGRVLMDNIYAVEAVKRPLQKAYPENWNKHIDFEKAKNLYDYTRYGANRCCVCGRYTDSQLSNDKVRKAAWRYLYNSPLSGRDNWGQAVKEFEGHCYILEIPKAVVERYCEHLEKANQKEETDKISTYSDLLENCNSKLRGSSIQYDRLRNALEKLAEALSEKSEKMSRKQLRDIVDLYHNVVNSALAYLSKKLPKKGITFNYKHTYTEGELGHFGFNGYERKRILAVQEVFQDFCKKLHVTFRVSSEQDNKKNLTSSGPIIKC